MSTAEFTKYMIAQGMKELLTEKDFEKISVGDLANHCHISRNTFYYHFRDKYDVVSWIFYFEITPLLGPSQFVGKWADALLTLCRYLQDNKTFLHQSSPGGGAEQFYRMPYGVPRPAGPSAFGERQGRSDPDSGANPHHLQFLCLRADRGHLQLGQKRHGR